MLKLLRKLFGNWWVSSLTLVAVAALILCVLAPLAFPSLGRLWIRLLLLALIGAVWGVFAILRAVVANRASARIARNLFDEEQATGEQRVLARRVSDAMAHLKTQSGKRRDYLYSRPWYVIIGPPAGGKTTALEASGLHFPNKIKKLEAASGTRNIDFMFADEAVLVDTAGRYTSQDSGDSRDRDGWQALLDLLRRHRPLQPINGVIVAIPLDTLARSGVAEIDEHAHIVRRRLNELRIGLQSAPPVYVMFTKADLIAGFVESFDDLLVDGRRAVLGATFPWTPDEPISPEALASAFDEVTESIAARMSSRLQEERDARRQSLILGFPSQVAALRARAVRLLDGAFRSPAQEQPMPLRGFYLTSGMQDGAPIDRIVASVGEVYDAPQPRASGGGRAFFVNRLLTDVIFREAGLARPAPALVAKRRTAIALAFATIGLASVVMAAVLMASFGANLEWQSKLTKAANDIHARASDSGLDRARVADTDLDGVQPLLSDLRNLPGGYAEQTSGFKFSLRQFLISDLGGKARAAYMNGLQRLMLPRLVLRLESELGDTSDSVRLYERLKVYRLLGGFQGKEPEPGAIVRWANEELRSVSLTGGDNARAALGADVQAMVDDDLYGRAWAGGRVPNKTDLVTAAQQELLSRPQADRAFALLIQQMSAGGRAWRIKDGVLDDGALLAFRDPRSVAEASVPYQYTRAGYQERYAGAMRDLDTRIQSEAWVLGQSNADAATVRGQMRSLQADVAKLYARAYTAAWERTLAVLQPADYFAEGDQGRQVLTAIKQRPLAIVLRQVSDNTKFSDSAAAKAGAMVQKRVFQRAPNAAAVGAIQGSTGFDAAREIENQFSALHRYTASPEGVDAFSKVLRDAVEASAAAKRTEADDTVRGDFTRAMARLEGAITDAPAGPVQNFVASASGKATGTIEKVNRTAVNSAYKRQALGDCASATEGLYPFVDRSGTDAQLAAMQRAFGVGGSFDTYINGNLVGPNYIDRSQPIWRWRQDDPVAASFDPSSAEQFMKAAQIRDLMANGVSFKILAIRFSGAATGADFVQGGASHPFEQGQGGSYDIVWMPGAGSYPAKVVLRGGTRPISFDGPWALVKLFNAAQLESIDPMRFNATFSDGTAKVTFQVTMRSQPNPFGSRFWSFRCPAGV
ncbi:type VI secretion system membrane subunit TssM [Caulobacter flavus]|uniref:Type VI secretion system membrane subunit TssM n=1 Tax=Caulobacter flavus TaxID=1679497 RepID=A0A2N5CZH2_9CAUL|nr:type VI secretion system membrane subunit TssM [Caulobacter flavus]PLR19192.1 type VI secretion system membrane subunit TssM [Caulobacter flavus]